MKKKKLEGLSLNKNLISKLGGSTIKGGIIVGGTRNCQEGSAASPCFSRDCEVISADICEQTEQNCESIHIHCL